jgi:carboxylesterase type B
VFAWIHGGWLQIGNPSHTDESQPPELIAEDGAGLQAIVVAIGYRLNIFGFLAGHGLKGNFGFWVYSGETHSSVIFLLT